MKETWNEFHMNSRIYRTINCFFEFFSILKMNIWKIICFRVTKFIVDLEFTHMNYINICLDFHIYFLLILRNINRMIWLLSTEIYPRKWYISVPMSEVSFSRMINFKCIKFQSFKALGTTFLYYRIFTQNYAKWLLKIQTLLVKNY